MTGLAADAERALKGGDWRAARDTYIAALEERESGEALFGLGIALWWLGETEESLQTWERAYAAFRRDAQPGQAVIAAVYLCLAFRMSLGNQAAANGWLERAASLAEEFDLETVAGWVLLARAYAANDDGHPTSAEGHARRALAAATAAADSDLALCATSELGAALLGMGDLERGGPLLDQAMAAALGGEADLDSVVLVSCRTITACSRAADVKRAVQWIHAADGFHRRYGSTHLFTTCRTHHGAVLFATGAWDEAEAELQRARSVASSAEAALRAEAAAQLAELRVAQGRLEEAEDLLAGLDDHPSTLYARATLQVATGVPLAAASALRRRLRDIDPAGIEAVRLTDVLTEAEVAAGSAPGTPAEALGSEPGRLAGHAVVRAYRARASGRALTVTSDGDAVGHLEAALSGFASAAMPYECARTRLLIAETCASTQPQTAVAEAKAALAAFDALGAARHADAAAALLRSLGVRSARTGAKGVGVLTNRELEVLGLLGQGLSNPAIAGRLYVSRKTVEHHVASVLRKLGLNSRAEAAAYAVRHHTQVIAAK